MLLKKNKGEEENTICEQKQSVKNQIGDKLNEYGDKYDEMKTKTTNRYAMVMNILNIFMTAIFIFLTVISLRKMQVGTAPFYITVAVIAVYGIMLIATIVIAVVNRKKANETIRQMGVAAKTINTTRGIMMKIIGLMNIAVSIMFTVENFNGSKLEKYFSLGALIFSLLLALFAVIKKIKKVRKTIKKEKKRKKKLEKKAAKSQDEQNFLKKMSSKISDSNQDEVACCQMENKNKRNIKQK